MKRKVLNVIICFLTLLGLIKLDLLDGFNHGYYSSSSGYDEISAEDVISHVNISKNEYVVNFKTMNKHFAGFVLFFDEDQTNNTGTIKLSIKDSTAALIDNIDVDVINIKNKNKYYVYSNKTLKENNEYSVTISAENCKKDIEMMQVRDKYISSESMKNNLLIGYAYKNGTFSRVQKCEITLFVISFLLLVLYAINNFNNRVLYKSGIFLLLASLMTWNYTFNTFNYKNSNFSNFQYDSEGLVLGTIDADKNGFGDSINSGLNIYCDVTGNHQISDRSFRTDDEFMLGYNNEEAQICIRNSSYSSLVAKIGNSILFENGSEYEIIKIETDATYTYLDLLSDSPLTFAENGSLSNVKFLDTNGIELPVGTVSGYASQYGLQGYIYRILARVLDVDMLRFITAFATAITLLIVVIMVGYKYDKLLAGIFYIVFLLGVWIIDFANNLYWVEFTWFLPMAAGLFCLINIDNKKCRIISYILVYIFVMIKSLCGYEYISTIMMGIIAFSLVELIISLINKNYKDARLLFKTIFMLGVFALAGFMTAICIHAPTKPGSNGNIISGIKIIFENDVLRRTSGADINNYTGVMVDSINTSIWAVLIRYFHFNTDIIAGIDGSLFPLLFIIPIAILLYDFFNKKMNLRNCLTYVIMFLTSISWFVLAKGHSYIHTHMNYVLWYFGFIQICFYIIIKKLLSLMNYKGK